MTYVRDLLRVPSRPVDLAAYATRATPGHDDLPALRGALAGRAA